MPGLFSRGLAAAILAFLPPSLALADTVGLSLSADSAEFAYNTGGEYTNPVDWGFTAYYNRVEEEDKQITSDYLLTLDLETSLEGDSSSRLLFSLGGDLYLLSLDRIPYKDARIKTDYNAGLSLGGKLGYLLTTAVPSLLYVGGYVSPNIVNTGRVEHLRRILVMFEVMLSPAAILQFGYHNYYVDLDKRYEHFEDPHKTFENRVVAGIKLRF